MTNKLNKSTVQVLLWLLLLLHAPEVKQTMQTAEPIQSGGHYLVCD